MRKQPYDYLPVATYCVGLFLIGILIGFFAGGSGTPIVGAVLPLLFSLIGGAGGFFISTANLGNHWQVRRIGILGLCLIVLSLGVLVGTFWGASIRTGDRWGNLMGFTANQPELSTIGNATSASNALALGLLDARIRSLEVNPSDRKAILELARAELDEKRMGLAPERIDAIVADIEALAALISEQEATGQANTFIPIAELLWRATLIAGMREGEEIFLRHGQLLFLREINRSLAYIANEPDIAAVPREQRKLVMSLYGKTAHAMEWLTNVNWATTGPLVDAVDNFIEVSKRESQNEEEGLPILVDRKQLNLSPVNLQ